MSYAEVVQLLIPCLTILYIYENAILRNMVDKEKLKKLETFKHIDNAICLILITFILCDLIEIISISVGGIWIYTVIGFVIGVAIAITILHALNKYFQKKVNENE